MDAVLLDTCVLLKSYLCDTLLSIAEAGTFRPLWSDRGLYWLIPATMASLVGGVANAWLFPHQGDQLATNDPALRFHV